MTSLLKLGVLLELLRLRMAQADEVIQFFFDGFDVVLAFHFASEWVVGLFWFES